MENQDIKRAAKVGAFVLGGIVIFLAALFYMGREGNLFNKMFTVSAIFKNVEGLKEGDNVWLSGVKIGTVKQVQIVAEGRVIVILSLKDKQNEFIKKDATAFVGSDGLVGNKIVVIRPGTMTASIENNDTLNALSPTDTQELFNIAKEVGVNARSLSNDLKIISSRLNKGEGILGELLHDGPVSSELRQVITALRTTGDNATEATAEIKQAVANINHGDGLITRLLTDSIYAHTFDTTMQNISVAGKNVKQMSAQLQQITGRMNYKSNAVGILLTDTAFAENLRSTMENTSSATYKLDENMEAMRHNFLFRGYFKKQKKLQKKDTLKVSKGLVLVESPLEVLP